MLSACMAAALVCGMTGCASSSDDKTSESTKEQSIEQSSEKKTENNTEGETESEPGNTETESQSETQGQTKGDDDMKKTVDQILQGMSLDEKISQMIIPAIRSWNDVNVTDLSAAEGLKEALCRHQYGGIILYGANISGIEQTARLLYDLQENNKAAEGVSTHIPYLLPLDQEGGVVVRLTYGTRMTGNMALGATADTGVENAFETGKIIGSELKALGFNADYGPVVDVNSNPSNPVIGTRSFSDDKDIVAKLGIAYADGLKGQGAIATLKHFPGHGDTSVDSHIGTPSVEKTYEQIKENELVPFKAAIDSGIDMIMTAHITYPLIDEEQTFGDGETKGFFPATMSKKMITDILRTDLGFDGVVVTDALEMAAIETAGLVKGEEGSVEYRVNIAEKVINAGVDILLLPFDMVSPEKADMYDEYISGIASKVETGDIDIATIDESVKRILEMKEKYGILDAYDEEKDINDIIYCAKALVGCEENHAAEERIAGEAITLIKNDDNVLPLSNEPKKITILGRQQTDTVIIEYTVALLKEQGFISDDTSVYVDYYYDGTAKGDDRLHFTADMEEMIKLSDAVIAVSYTGGAGVMADSAPQYKALSKAIELTHEGNGKFIFLSTNLPYDAARYTASDAILLSYLGSALNTDPTERTGAGGEGKAYNANIIASLKTVFGANAPKGKLPVNIPAVSVDEEGNVSYSDELLFERGFGLSFE